MNIRKFSLLAALTDAAMRAGRMPLGNWGEFEGGGAPPESLAQLAQYGIMDPSALQVIRQPLYDRLVYDDLGVTQMRFFQQPQGQGASSATGATGNLKTLDDTNMEAAGQLPSPKMQLVTSIEVMVEPGSISTANAWSPQDVAFATNASITSVGAVPQLNAQNDITRILQAGWLDFFIGSGSLLQNSRLDSFPPKSYIAPFGANSQAVSLGATGIALTRAVGRAFYLNPPILIMPNTNFVVALNFAVAVATPTGQNARITVRLDGFQYRRAQ